MKKLIMLIAFSFIGHNANAQSIWLTMEEIMQLPTEGQEWRSVYDAASANWGSANVSDQNSKHDVYTLAGALVYARTGEFYEKTKNALLSAIGTEEGSRWLAIGRNLTVYTIAADLMNLRSDGNPDSDGTRIQNWFASFLTRTLRENNSSKQEKLTPFKSGSNASAQEGAVYVAIAAYLNAQDKLEYAWNRFRLYSGDKTNNPETEIDIRKGFEKGWSHADKYEDACAVNPKGTTKNGIRIDGVIINDQRRGGDFHWPPGYTSYPWVGLEGYVPAAVILHRMGYPAFEIADKAVYRAVDWLWYLRQQTGNESWFDGKRADEIIYLVNEAYGQTWNHHSPVGAGRTIGFTDWSHKNGIGGNGIQPPPPDTTPPDKPKNFRVESID